jgi:hypothetical protein
LNEADSRLASVKNHLCRANQKKSAQAVGLGVTEERAGAAAEKTLQRKGLGKA